jgi:hypothetical protein
MGTPNSWASSLHIGAPNIPSPSQRGTTHPSNGHTQLMGFLTPHRGTQHSISISKRKNTLISWKNPTHGLSHMPTHSFCVLEDVSCNCNHQHVAPSYEIYFFPGPLFFHSSFLSYFKDKLKATFLAWCPYNDSVTHKHPVEMRRMAPNETPFLSTMQSISIALAW